jgi:aerobic-type carbon monoxide dehydrogenase small subunit (CoxS/CutS family)
VTEDARLPGGSPPAALDVELIVNGRVRHARIPPHARLLSVLRDELRVTEPKAACEVGVCGACTVLVDGKLTSSCIVLAAQADGSVVQTVDGLPDQSLVRKLRQAFIDEGGFQCGFCTHGQIMTAASIVASRGLGPVDVADLVDMMEGNLCRCTGYYGICRAIRSALETGNG